MRMKRIIVGCLCCFSAFGQAVTIGPATFSGVGLNDAISGGRYVTAPANAVYAIVISATGTPDQFKWSKNGGALSGPINITGAVQTITDGVTVTFAATTGHTLADSWSITTTASGSGNASSFIQRGIGARFRSVEDKLREMVSVLDFARGDGSDETVQIQRAIDYACTLTGGPGNDNAATLNFPTPQVYYHVSSTLTRCARVELAGFRSTIYYTGSGPLFLLKTSSYGSVHGFHMLGTGAARTWGVKCAGSVDATTTGTASSGSTMLTVANGTGINAGENVSAAGISDGVFVVAVSGVTVTLSEATTASLSAIPVVFSGTSGCISEHIYDNKIENFGDTATQSGGAVWNAANSERISVDHNFLYTNGTNVLFSSGGDKADISDNDHLNPSGRCIDIYNTLGTAMQIVEGENLVCKKGMVRFQGTGSAIITKNEAEFVDPFGSTTNPNSAAFEILGGTGFAFVKVVLNYVTVHNYAKYCYYVDDFTANSSFEGNHCLADQLPGGQVQFGFRNGNGDQSNTYRDNRLWLAHPNATLYEFPNDPGVVVWPPASYHLSDSASVARTAATYINLNTLSGATYSGGLVTFACTMCDIQNGQLVQITTANPAAFDIAPGQCFGTYIDVNHFSCPFDYDPGTWVSGGLVAAVRSMAFPYGDVRFRPYNTGTFMERKGSGGDPADSWCHYLQNGAATDAGLFCQASTAYETGGTFAWVKNDATFLRGVTRLSLGVSTTDNVGLDVWGNGIGIGCHPNVNQTGICLEKVLNASISNIPVGSFAYSPDTQPGTCAGGGSGAWVYTNPGPTLTCTDQASGTLPNTGVTAGTYGDASHSTQVTVDAKGRATGASSVAINGGATGTVAFSATCSFTPASATLNNICVGSGATCTTSITYVTGGSVGCSISPSTMTFSGGFKQ